jgi:hypothetical protein
MLVGMQFGIGKLFSINGPFGLPRFGLITSTEPMVKSTPSEFELVTRNLPVLGLKTDPPIPAIEGGDHSRTRRKGAAAGERGGRQVEGNHAGTAIADE